MHWLLFLLFGLIAAFWLTYGLRVLCGAMRLPRLEDCAPSPDENCPRISILFAARDEEEKLPAALESLVALDYPVYEIVAVDDRSSDSTGAILHSFAVNNPHLRVVRVGELPEGWLGKPHALQKAFEASSGELLLFTDADVRFRPDSLRRAVALFSERKLDHLTLMCGLEMQGFWEKMLLTFFGQVFELATDPQRLSNPKSRSYVGIGAFQLVRRSVYLGSGTHRRLALEVVDDLKLAKILRQAGARSCVGFAQEHISLRWHAGFANIVRGVTKNFFAAAAYRLEFVAAHCAVIFLISVLPFLALPFLGGWKLVLAGVSVAVALAFQGCAAAVMKVSPLYALTQPIGALAYIYMVLRSTAVTLWRGGVVWRGTFYRLDELKRGGSERGKRSREGIKELV